jgi:hypothetical protein
MALGQSKILLDIRTTRLRRPHHTPFVKGASASTASRPASVTIASRPSECLSEEFLNHMNHL